MDDDVSPIWSSQEISRLPREHRGEDYPIRVSFRSISSEISFRDRATHFLHPYPAKLLPQIPYYFINQSGLDLAPDSTILDPFCGSGTVLVEACLAGLNSIGIDINPFAVLLSRVKTHGDYSASRLKYKLSRILKRAKIARRVIRPDVVNLGYWYSERSVRYLSRIMQAIDEETAGAENDFFKVCFSIVARESSNADPRLLVPVRLNPEKVKDKQWLYTKLKSHKNRVNNYPYFSSFESVTKENIKRASEFTRIQESSAKAQVLFSLRELEKQAELTQPLVDMVVTSPPYPGAQKYIRSASLSLGWLNLAGSNDLAALKKQTVGREEVRWPIAGWEEIAQRFPSLKDQVEEISKRNPQRGAIAAAYFVEMDDTLKRIYKLIKPGGYAVFVVSNNSFCGLQLRTPEHLLAILKKWGFYLCSWMNDPIISRSFMTNRANKAEAIDSESVIVVRKP